VVAFGANLLGAMVGGLLEYGALVVGYRALLLVVAGLYGLAFAFRPREATRVPAMEVAAEHRHMELTATSSQLSLTETMRRRKLPKL
jgi:hypothetical protein